MRNREEINGGSLIEVDLGKSTYREFASSLRRAASIYQQRGYRHKRCKDACQLTLVLEGIPETPIPTDTETRLNGILKICFLSESSEAKRRHRKALRLSAYVVAAASILAVTLCLASTRISNFLAAEYHSGFHHTTEQIKVIHSDRQ